MKPEARVAQVCAKTAGAQVSTVEQLISVSVVLPSEGLRIILLLPKKTMLQLLACSFVLSFTDREFQDVLCVLIVQSDIITVQSKHTLDGQTTDFRRFISRLGYFSSKLLSPSISLCLILI